MHRFRIFTHPYRHYNLHDIIHSFLYKASFPGRKPPSPVGAGNAYTPARAGFVGDEYTPANETPDLVSLNMAAPV